MTAHLLKLLSSAAIELADAELLARFVSRRDGAAFAELVRRYGPGVYQVCRRLAGPSADDAFQATFLVLACRAGGVRKAGSVGSWLIGVAGRVARQVRNRDRRSGGPTPPAEWPDRPTSAGRVPELAELAAALDDELTRLPDALRDPVVLCLVQGRTQEQAAAELGGSVRTLRRRLDRARALLRLRLERRGVVPAVAAGLVAGVGATAPAVPAGLAGRTGDGVFQFLAGGAPTPPAVIAKGVVAGMVSFKHWAVAAGVGLLGLGLALAGASPPEPAAGQPPPLPSVPAGTPPPPQNADPTVPPPTEAVPPAGSVSHRSANFLVYAPTPTMARAIAAEAEYQRAALAKQWLGNELGPWESPCEIRFPVQGGALGCATSFSFGTRKSGDGAQVMTGCRMELRGEFLAVLTNGLPHEVMHTVLATHFARPLPRWADEGLAVCCEGGDSQSQHDIRCRELL